MGTDNVMFLEVIEWFDDTGQELVHRIPEKGSGEIKWGAQLTVRESQAGVFFYNGKAVEAFGAGRHTLKTGNIPILNKIMAIPWGLKSPLRAEVYMVNLKNFANLKWGTRDPVAFRDSQLGTIRLRAHGVFNVQVFQPLLFINRLVGTMGLLTTADIEEYLKRVIVSRLNDFLGEKLDTMFNLAGQYDEMAEAMMKRLQEDFTHFGLALTHLYITSITPPPEVQSAIDERSRMSAIGNLDDFVKMKAAMAMEKAAANPGGGAGEAMGMGMGFMMPAMFAQHLQVRPGGGGGGGAAPAASPPGTQTCPECQSAVAPDAHFCSACGHQIMVFDQCSNCAKNIPPNAKFCPKCGQATAMKPKAAICANCKAENLPGSTFCNQCGEKLGG